MSLSKFLSSHLGSLALTGAVVTGLYILLGPSLSPRRKKVGAVVGLVNVNGNTCFKILMHVTFSLHADREEGQNDMIQ